jgi:hypothetical protein
LMQVPTIDGVSYTVRPFLEILPTRWCPIRGSQSATSSASSIPRARIRIGAAPSWRAIGDVLVGTVCRLGCFHPVPGELHPDLSGSIRADGGDVLRRRDRPGRVAGAQWPCTRLAAIFKRQIRYDPARSGARGARHVGGQLCRALAVPGLHPRRRTPG